MVRLRTRSAPRSLALPAMLTPPSPSHSEDAEAPASLDRARGRRGQGDAESSAGVARIEQAVVVEPCGDEEGVRLGLDLRLDGAAAHVVGRLVELAAGGSRGSLAHDRE